MGGMPGFPGMGMPGFGEAAAPKMRVLSKGEKNARKNERKRARDARKKSKGKK